MQPRIDIPKERLIEFCRRSGIRRMALFGSVMREDFSPESDVDVLVEFEPGRIPGLSFFALQRELSRLSEKYFDCKSEEIVQK